jgi:hypothetical protein
MNATAGNTHLMCLPSLKKAPNGGLLQYGTNEQKTICANGEHERIGDDQ